MTRRSYKGNSQPTTLTAPINSSDLAATVADGSTLPDGTGGPFVLLFDLNVTGEEKVLCASRTGNNLVITTRGYDGTAAAAHSAGASVRHTISAVDLDESNAHVNDTTRDDHTQYRAVAARGARAYASAAANVANSVLATVALDGESFDTNTLHSTVTNNSRILLNKTGLWQVSGVVSFATNPTGYRTVDIGLNGARTAYAVVPAATGQETNVPISVLVQATAITDYVEMRAVQNSGGALALNVGAAYTWLAVTWVGA